MMKRQIPSTQHRIQRSIVVLLWLAILATLLLRESLTPNYTFLPLDLIQTIAPWDDLDLGPLKNPLISDPFYTFYPNRELLTKAVQNGQLPLWNPMIMGGVPTASDPVYQLFYPPNLLAALFLPTHQALPWLVWAQLIITGGLMYLFLSQHKLHWLACLSGATVWMLNGYALVWLENAHRLSTLTWIPGLFWAYEKAVRSKSIAWAAVGGIMLGLSILGGQMQFVFATGLMLGVYGAVTIGETFFQKRAGAGRAIIYLIVIGLIGLGIGALILLPANEFAEMSQRIKFSSDTIQNTRWPLRHLITLFAPNFYGNPVGQQSYWSHGNYAETAAYFGAVALFLVLTAPFIAVARRFTRIAFITMGVVLALVLGSPLARLMFALPGAQFIVLGRLLFLIPLAGSWLTAIALDGWLRQSASRQRQIISVLFAGSIIFILTMWVKSGLGENFIKYQSSILADLGRSVVLVTLLIVLLALIPRLPKIAPALIVVLIGVDLLTWGWNFNPITSTQYLYPDNDVVEFLNQDSGLYRVVPLQAGKVVFGPNVLGLYGQQTIGGYSSLINGNYQQLFKSIDDEVEIWWMKPNRNMLVMSHFQPLVSLLNVKYVLSAHPLAFDIIPQEKRDGCLETAVITSDPITQSFTVDTPGLNRVDITVVGTGSGSAEFWLWRDQVNGELVAHTSVSTEDIGAKQAVPFFFAPVADSTNQTFVWGIQGDGAAICRSDEGGYTFAAYATWLQHRDIVDGVWIYENPNVAPRAFLVHHVEQQPESDVLTALNDPDFNWYHSAIVSEPLPDEWQRQMSDVPIRTASSVTITDYQSQQIDIHVDTPAAGLLVLSDSFYPGWQVTVDGQETAVYRVNHALRGVLVPAGVHEIQFRFRPKILQTAVIIASISLLVAIVLIIKYGRWRLKFRE